MRETKTFGILVVDDVEENRYLLKTIFESQGFPVDTAENGEEALSLLRTGGYQMIVSDILMPVMDGYELCHACKNDPALKNVFFIFYTATYTDQEDKDYALSLGADQFLVKPMEPLDFLSAIQDVVNKAEEEKPLPKEPMITDGEAISKHRDLLLKKLNKKVDELQTENAERKKAEQKIRHLNLVLRSIRSVNRLIVREKDRDVLIKTICTDLTEIQGYLSAWIALFDAKRRYLTSAESGFGKGFIPLTDLFLRGSFNSCCIKAFEQPDIVIIKDCIAECGDCPLLYHDVDRKSMVLRLEHEGTIYGILSVSVPSNMTIDSEEQGLIKEVADDIALALHDIELTEQRNMMEKMLGENEKKYRTIFEGGAQGILAADIITKKFIYANHALCRMLGYSEEELKTMGVADIHPKESLEDITAGFDAQARGEKNLSSSVPCLCKDGSLVYMDIMTSLLEIENSSCNVGFFTDVTARKQADEKLKNTLKERELLIRELYHRTKNNMQVIYSMMRIHARGLKNKQLRDVINNMGNKILTMSMVHQKLYESKDLSFLNLKDYIQSLALEMKKQSPANSHDIPISVTGDDVKVLIDTAIPCGLIINELITNALKHAFIDGGEGKISVDLSLTPKSELVIEVSDNGVGLPDGFDHKKDIQIGLKSAIDMVEHQLQGKIDFINRKGLSVRIVLPEEQYKKRV